jgi:SAM-dependent methyltransferase
LLPEGRYRALQLRWRRIPPRRLGLARRLEPLGRSFGYGRGTPIHRHYIERFIADHAADIRGQVLEFGDPGYTTRFGGERVVSVDVMSKTASPHATLIGDLESGAGVPSERYDCVIATQVLQYVYDLPAALGHCRRAIRTGGVILATLPGIEQINAVGRELWGEYWRFMPGAVERLFAGTFGAENVTVEAFGNLRTVASGLYGLTVEELPAAHLDHRDPDYPMVVAVRAVRAP